MSLFEKWTGPALMGLIALIGIWSAANTDWKLDAGFKDGATQEALQDRFDAALVIRDPSITAWGTGIWALFDQASDGAVIGRDGWLFTDEEYLAEPGFDDRLAASLRAAEDAHAQLTAAGTQVVIALIPDKARIMGAYLKRPRAPRIEARYDALLDGLAARGIETLDLRPALTQGQSREDMFLKTDTHWTPAGARVVAEALAPQIRALGLAETEFDTQPTEILAHSGDLMRYLPLINPKAAGFPDQDLPRYATVAAGGDLLGGGLFGDAPALGALIGTSFSANPNWHFVGWLKQASHIDLLNRADEGQGPFAPMRAYLADAGAQAENTAQLVIWEIPERYTTLGE